MYIYVCTHIHKYACAAELRCLCNKYNACAANTVPVRQIQCLRSTSIAPAQQKHGACAAETLPVQQKTQCLCHKCSACVANAVPV